MLHHYGGIGGTVPLSSEPLCMPPGRAGAASFLSSRGCLPTGMYVFT